MSGLPPDLFFLIMTGKLQRMEFFSTSTLTRTIVWGALIFMLSGCGTVMLHEKIDSEEHNSHQFSTDKIIGLSLAQDSNSQKGWVFIGEHFDYLLTSGGDDIAAIINSEELDRHNLTVTYAGHFAISGNKKTFTGEIPLNYHYHTGDDAKKVREILTAKGFTCYDNKGTDGDCTSFLQNLKGSIHAKNKNQDNSKILMFYKPFEVGFYTSSGISASRLLYPVTVAVDAVTLPLQLIGVVVVVGSAGSGGWH